MRWEDERYVRLYTRNTVEWEMMPWQSRALWPLLLREVDRAGLLELGKHGARGLAALVKMPAEVVEPGLAGLLDDGCAELHGTQIVIPNFIEAQEATQSDAQRKRESRERARAVAVLAVVTNRDVQSQNVTSSHETGPNVTNGHKQSQVVTSGHSVPCLTVPSVPSEPEDIAGFVLESSEALVSKSDLAAAYDSYPLKEGKQKGLDKLVKQVKTRTDLQRLQRAIGNYAAQRKADGKYLLHFSTFAGEWQDWIDWQVTTPPPQTNGKTGHAPAAPHNTESRIRDDF
jgi:hypothetical protein